MRGLHMGQGCSLVSCGRGKWRPWGLWARKGKKKHVRRHSIVQGKERWLMLISKGSKYRVASWEQGISLLWKEVSLCMGWGIWHWNWRTMVVKNERWWLLHFSGNFLSEKKFLQGMTAAKLLILFILFFHLLLYCVGRLCCPTFPVAVWVRCLSGKNLGRWEWQDVQWPAALVCNRGTESCLGWALLLWHTCSAHPGCCPASQRSQLPPFAPHDSMASVMSVVQSEQQVCCVALPCPSCRSQGQGW